MTKRTASDITNDQVILDRVAKAGFMTDEQLDGLARVLDTRYAVPFTPFRIGLDGLVGLIPVVGDISTTALSLGIVAEGWKRGLRKRTLARMLANTGIDFAIGTVPLVGDLFDIAFSANIKNIALIKAEKPMVPPLMPDDYPTA